MCARWFFCVCISSRFLTTFAIKVILLLYQYMYPRLKVRSNQSGHFKISIIISYIRIALQSIAKSFLGNNILEYLEKIGLANDRGPTVEHSFYKWHFKHQLTMISIINIVKLLRLCNLVISEKISDLSFARRLNGCMCVWRKAAVIQYHPFY